MNQQEEKETVEAEDGSRSQHHLDVTESRYLPNETSDRSRSAPTLHLPEDANAHNASRLSSVPSEARHNVDQIQVDLGLTDDDLRGRSPMPNASRVLSAQNEEVIFGDQTRIEDGTPRICYDGSSPVMHPTRRSTIDHNVHIDRANRLIDRHMKSMVTPMRTSMTYNPIIVTDPPRVERNTAYFVNAGGGGGGPPSEPSSSTSTNRSSNGNNGGGPPNDPPDDPSDDDIGPPSPYRCRRCGRVHPAGPCPCASCGQIHPPGQCPDNADRLNSCRHCGRLGHESNNCPTLPVNDVPYKTQIINGRNFQVRDRGLRETEFTGRKCWNKFLRWKLTSEDRIAFDKAASGYVLSKHNKLRVVQVATNDQDILQNLLNTHNQLRSLKAHVNEYDIGDVFTVVLPIEDTPDPHARQCDLFVDCSKIAPAMVALSNRYYNMWIDEMFIPENLNLTYALIKNNMDEVLYGQCLEEYEKYSDICQGGPLLFIICIHKINKVNAQHRDHMWTRVKKLEIRKVKGEDVNHVVSLLNAAYATFRAVSTDKDGMNCVPQDWSEQVIKIFQTSSVSKFNEIFEHEEELAHRAAARTLGHAVWPVHDELMTLASRQYERFKQANDWCASKAISKKGYLTQTSGIRDLSQAVCDNCSKKGHLSTNCTQPKDPDRMARNRKKRIEKLKQTRPKSAKKASTPSVKRNDAGELLIDGLVYKVSKEDTWCCADPAKQAERKAKGERTRAATAATRTTPAPNTAPPATPTSSTQAGNPVTAAVRGTPSQAPTQTTTEGRRNLSTFFTGLH